MRISPPDPRRFYERLRDQLSLGACARLFGEAIAPYGIEAFACGEVDLADRDRTVTHLAEWPPDCDPCYFECAFVPRDPVISALGTVSDGLRVRRTRPRPALRPS